MQHVNFSFSQKKPQLLIENAVSDGHVIAIKFRYYPGVADAIRAGISGPEGEIKNKSLNNKKKPTAYYHGNATDRFYRYWSFSVEILRDHVISLYEFLSALPDQDLGVIQKRSDFLDVIANAVHNPDPGAFSGSIKGSIYPLTNGGCVYIGNFHSGLIANLKANGGIYLASMTAWQLSAITPTMLKTILDVNLVLRDEQITLMETAYQLVNGGLVDTGISPSFIQVKNSKEVERGDEEPPNNAIYSAAAQPLKDLEIPEDALQAGLESYDLYDYQQAGFRHLASKTSALLADDMGLGKTRQALCAAHFLVHHSTNALGANENSCKILIACPADLLLNWVREIGKIFPDDIVSVQKYDDKAKWIINNYERLESMQAHATKFLVMITDEAHLLKEATAQRTRKAFDLAAVIPIRFLLTGTPVLNRESELHTLLRLSGHPLGDISIKDFTEQFAGSSEFRKLLNKRISEWCLRRLKKDVLKNLKGKQRQTVYLTLGPEYREAYDEIANDGELYALQKIGMMMTLLEKARLESILQMVQGLAFEDKFIVFCNYKNSVAETKERLGAMGIKAVSMTGEDSKRKRQAAIDTFQTEDDVRAIVCTTAVGCVGHNITAANYVLFASQPWTAAIKSQAEDRAYRNGQTRTVVVKDLLFEETIDGDMLEMLAHKENLSNDILDPDAAESAASDALAKKMEGAAPRIRVGGNHASPKGAQH